MGIRRLGMIFLFDEWMSGFTGEFVYIGSPKDISGDHDNPLTLVRVALSFGGLLLINFPINHAFQCLVLCETLTSRVRGTRRTRGHVLF